MNRHLPALRADKAFDLVGVVDRRSDRARAWPSASGCAATTHRRAAWPGVPWLDEVELSWPRAPPRTAPLSARRSTLGRHVLAEPFVMDPAEGEALVALARDRGRVLAVVHNFQFARSTRRLLADLQAGATASALHARSNGNPSAPPAGVVRRATSRPVLRRESACSTCCARLPPAPLEFRGRAGAPEHARQTHAGVDLGALQCRAPPHSGQARHGVRGAAQRVARFGGRRAQLGDVDVFRDIYVRIPNDGAHHLARAAHLARRHLGRTGCSTFVSGPRHLAGALLYGNDEVSGASPPRCARAASRAASGRRCARRAAHAARDPRARRANGRDACDRAAAARSLKAENPFQPATAWWRSDRAGRGGGATACRRHRPRPGMPATAS